MKKDTILKEWFERYQLTDGQNALLAISLSFGCQDVRVALPKE